MAERKPEKKKEKTKTKKTFPMWIIPILAFALLIFTCAFFKLLVLLKQELIVKKLFSMP